MTGTKAHVPTVAIIGGGFSGAAVAWHLRASTPDTEIVMIEPQRDLGRGLAYSTNDPAHRINVPAVRMSIDNNMADDFQDWVVETDYLAGDPDAALPDERLFPSRYAFGSYLGDRIGSLKPAVRHIQSKAVTVERSGNEYRVLCDNGETVQANAVVIAVCHAPPETPRSLASLQDHPRFFANPWQNDARSLIGTNDRVLIVGTGLTMADIVASLDRAGHRGEIVAVSRRGMRSQPHTDDLRELKSDFTSPPSMRASELVKRVRGAVIEAAQDGKPWQLVLDRVREQGQIIWQALPAQERLRVLRHLRPYWDVHRFRIAPQIHRVLEQRLADGSLALKTAAVRAVPASGAGLAVEFRQRREQQWKPERFDALMLATGPGHASVVQTNPLLARLVGEGLMRPNIFHFGVDVDPEGHAISGAGGSQARLYVAGPLARGTFGELMGISDLADYAEKIARRLALELTTSQDTDQLAST
ncbi:MAG: FAD/NAD(P)-binding protein [Xanthobacteraceae bacterium]|nr:FAD/NAD(P)-binding protein [Xanthobacteraceae bacterium]